MSLGPYLERAVQYHRERAKTLRTEAARFSREAANAAEAAEAEDAAADYIVTGVAKPKATP